IDAYRIAVLVARERFAEPRLLRQLLHPARIGLEYYSQADPFTRPARYRLACRELGLSIGLRGLQRLRQLAAENHRVLVGSALEDLTHYLHLAESIESFWLRPESQQAES